MKKNHLESNVSACKIFLGIQFQHSSSGKADGYNFGQQSALRVNQANDVKISNCEFSHIGMTGLFFANSNRHSIYLETVRPLPILIFIFDTFIFFRLFWTDIECMVQRYNHRGDLYNYSVPIFQMC